MNFTELDPELQKTVLRDVNYMNVKEYRGFCDKHGIPYRIRRATVKGSRATGDVDRKDIVMNRIRHFLKTGELLPQTLYPLEICAPGPRPRSLSPQDRLYYGWYDKHAPEVLTILKACSGGAYENGSIGRVLMRSFWARGIAPTFADYGAAWLEAVESYAGPSAEYAYLSDLQVEAAGPDWKEKRTARAAAALEILNRIPIRD